jgi:hypothetical protein
MTASILATDAYDALAFTSKRSCSDGWSQRRQRELRDQILQAATP